MADKQTKTLTLTAVTTTAAQYDTYFSTETMRDLVFSVEVSATGANSASDTITVVIEHSNSDSGNFSSSNDNYWNTFYSFAAIAGNSTLPYIIHVDMCQATTASSTTNVKRSIGKWCRFKYTIVNGSGTGAWTGVIRASWNVATTTT